MRIYEFGKDNPERILLIHPSLVTWDYFENMPPRLEKDYHLLIPALPGYDLNDDSQFSSVEKIASELADDLQQKGIREVKAVYGCSMGGSVALRMAADGRLKAQNFILDGGITPYQLPWLLTRFIALRDFGMMAMGKLGGEKVVVKAFSSSQYSEEDLKYVANIFQHCTYRTLWNTFDSCNNYKMPKEVMRFPGRVYYWYAEKERKARDWDLKYMKKFVPDTVFKCFEGMDHGDMALFSPDLMARELRELCEREGAKS
ncbi:MAG: alpha/beta hydrolase [Clostridia bacterium]|nr:alpha/beta hydrolase [Clostridia bacterium]